MAFQCGFFNSVNGDRRYTAEQMNNPYKGIVSNGVLAKTDDSTSFQVQEKSGLNIVVKEGYGIFADKWAILDADLQLTIPTPHVSYARIDSVIVRIDNNENVRAGSIEYVQGTPATNPAAPALTRNSTVMEYRLANIRVPANATSVSQATITDTRPSADCGFVTNLLQNSDISATYAQWEAQFNEWLASRQTEYNTWSNNKKSEYENFVSNEKSKYNQFVDNKQTEYENFVAAEQKSYNDFTTEKQTEYENFVDDYTNYINAQRTEHEEFITTEQAEYNEWTNEKRTAYEKWFNNLTEDLTVGAFLQHFSNHYVTTAENETVIPIGISQYSSTLDILKVYINGLMLIPNVDYIINDFSSITLTQAVDTNTTIAFDLLKLVAITEDIETVATQLQEIKQEVVDLDATTQFTFVVDSDEKLAKWANNDTSNGEDYTSVLIQKGTWKSSVGVNLTTTKTKVVVGAAGSKLNFSNVEKALFFEELHCDNEYYIQNVSLDNSNSNSTACYGFYNCNNLTNCTSTSTGSTTSTGSCYSFYNCNNLTNCTGSTTGSRTGFDFYNCSNLTNCTSSSTCTYFNYSFYSCSNLTNCTSTSTGSTTCYSFYNCSNLTNCTGSTTSTGSCYSFYNCSNLTNCTGSSTSTEGYGYSFYNCSNLTNCTGSSTGTEGYGFCYCYGVSRCKANGNCTTKVFNECFASQSYNSTYTVANTPEGGFNNTTNPTA